MVLDKNTFPYFDDYNEAKKFLQILFRPGRPVQARELSQIQSILQNQVSRFGDHIFKDGSMVIPGAVGVELDTPYLKLATQFNSVDIDVEDFDGEIIYGTTSGTIAEVVEVLEEGAGSVNTLYLKLLTGNSQQTFTANATISSNVLSSISLNATTKLRAGMVISGTGIPANTYITSITNDTTIVMSNAATASGTGVTITAVTSDSFTDGENIITSDGNHEALVEGDSNGHEGFASRVQIKQGIYYTNGYFCLVEDQSILLDNYSNTPSYKVGLNIVDSFVTGAEDVSLVDPATGTGNLNAPGADRYKIDLILTKYALDATLPDGFIELVRVENGIIVKLVDIPSYSELERTLARRTFDESGDYVVKNFTLQTKEHLDDGTNFGQFSSSNGGDEAKFVSLLGPGKAYVRGFEIDKRGSTLLVHDKARDTASKNNAVIPFTLGNYVDVDNLNGIFNISTYEVVELYDAAKDDSNYPGSLLGTARVRGIEFISGTPGDAASRYRIYLFDIDMDSDSSGVSFSFSNVKSISTSGQTKDCDIILEDGIAVLKGVADNRAIVKLPDTYIRTLEDGVGGVDTNYTVKRFSSGTMTGNSLTITGASNEIFSSFSVTNYQAYIITASGTATGNGFAAGDIIDLTDAGNSVTLGGSPTGRQVTITVPDIADSEIGVIVTVTKSEQGPKTKTLTTRSQTIAFSNIISLDRADIFDIVSITVDDTNAEDITDRFTLDNGQRDNFYDLGRVIYDTNYATPSGDVVIEYRYFEHGAGDYFSVDSYDGVIDYGDIPEYISPVSGTKYNLRDCLDFRPRVNNAGTGFSVTSQLVAIGSNIQCDYDYYLGRVDKIFLDSAGNFSVVKGLSAKNPNVAKTPDNGIVLYELDIPPYTSDISRIVIKKADNRRYTMRDIGRLEKRIENLEYYSSLSLLEKDTSDLFIDDGTGANRFKNGFLVDNFTSHLIGDHGLLEYACSIDKTNNILRPQFYSTSTKLELSVSDSSNYQKTGDVITLPYTEIAMIDQPFASKTENINPYDVFNWVGSLQLTPESDEWFEETQAPDRIILNDDGLADSLAALNGQVIWNDWQTNWVGRPIQTTNLVSRDFRQFRNGGTGGAWRNVSERTDIVTRDEGQSRTGVRINVEETSTLQSLGDRIINTAVIPWIRENDVEFSCANLKPNTRLYAFFDDVPVSQYVTPTGGSLGDDIVSDSSGSVSGTFSIPNNDTVRFRTGERLFRLTDSVNNDRNFATTSADSVYTAAGTLNTLQENILSTRSARLVTTTVSEDRVIRGTDIQQRRIVSGWIDPLAQTILVDSEGGCFVSKIDVYFATKDSNIPVTLQIRNVVNGYPGKEILPFAEVTLNPSSVNTSNDSSVATSFTFPSPVYLEDGEEYCFVLLANSTEYTIWTSVIGEFDVASGERISRQPYAGVMFKSQNASTWTADQTQDMKFKVYKCQFNTGVNGSVVFKNLAPTLYKLAKDPFTTTNASNVVNVYHPNHGLRTGDTTTIANVSGTQNNIPNTELNDTHTVTRIDIDNYTITVSTNANATGICGGSGITATRNIRTDVANVVFEQLSFQQTPVDWSIRMTDQNEVLHTSYIPIDIKENIEFTDERIVYSAENEPTSKSVLVKSDFSTNNANLSPFIDIQRASIISVSNRINNSSTDETLPQSGEALARYITKKIQLATPATGARVYFSCRRPPLANVKVYIKYLENQNQNGLFDDQEYVELTQVSYPEGNENAFREYVFEIDNLNPYSVYAIKIVMLSDETSDVPLIADFRTIALA